MCFLQVPVAARRETNINTNNVRVVGYIQGELLVDVVVR
jgi:hypothetical protein